MLPEQRLTFSWPSSRTTCTLTHDLRHRLCKTPLGRPGPLLLSHCRTAGQLRPELHDSHEPLPSPLLLTTAAATLTRWGRLGAGELHGGQQIVGPLPLPQDCTPPCSTPMSGGRHSSTLSSPLAMEPHTTSQLSAVPGKSAAAAPAGLARLVKSLASSRPPRMWPAARPAPAHRSRSSNGGSGAWLREGAPGLGSLPTGP